MHQKHSGPKAPLMCPHQICKRSSGKGFTRRENLLEHLRRVHAPGPAGSHQHQTSADPHDDDAEPESPPAMSRKRKRSLGDDESLPASYAPAVDSDDGVGDLHEQVKRLKGQIDEKDRRLRDLEASVATLTRQMLR